MPSVRRTFKEVNTDLQRVQIRHQINGPEPIPGPEPLSNYLDVNTLYKNICF